MDAEVGVGPGASERACHAGGDGPDDRRRQAVFIVVDHCSAEGVGVHVARSANRFKALEPVRQRRA